VWCLTERTRYNVYMMGTREGRTNSIGKELIEY
jgi:hypothetical protein